jgi:hypothetical protein
MIAVYSINNSGDGGFEKKSRFLLIGFLLLASLLAERFKLEFRMEAFNFSNTPHFGNPGGNVSQFNPELTDPL